MLKERDGVDREKVIKGLMCIAGDVVFCAHCKYSDVNGSGRGDRCKRDCAKDALALMKAQEQLEPRKIMAKGKIGYKWRFYCSRCGNEIDRLDKFCKHCGQAVKWE